MNLPQKFLENMQELLGDDYEKYIESLSKPKNLGIRINTLKINNEDFFKLIGRELPKIPWTDNGFYIDKKDEFSKSVYYQAGLYYIQEPSAMSVASFMPINEGDFVLDMCASPGGKATHIGAKLNGTGYLVANDISPGRCKALIKNIEMAGITNATITSENHKNLEKCFENYFDKIVLDVPCSGEGMFKSDQTAINDWNEDTNLKYQEIQLEILESAKKMLKNDGIISYSTCTFSVCENEMVIDKFLSDNKDFSVLPINNQKYGFSNGLLKNPINESVNSATRIFPHMIDGEGHFLCLLKRKGGEDVNRDKQCKQEKIDKNLLDMIDIYKKFEKECINKSFFGKYVYHEASLFLVHKDFNMLSKIRTMRSGFYLGDVKNKKFKPSQALASALNNNCFKNVINLDTDSDNLTKYLKGETIIENCEDGYVLICASGFPLGFGIAKDSKIKNKYGKSMLI